MGSYIANVVARRLTRAAKTAFVHTLLLLRVVRSLNLNCCGFDIHDMRCAQFVRGGSDFVLAPGYEAREKDRQDRMAKKKIAANLVPWDAEMEKTYHQKLSLKVTKNKEALRLGEDDVILVVDPVIHADAFKSDPRNLTDDLVLQLMSKGYPLTILERSVA